MACKEDTSSLCPDCTLCCDGTLFSSIPLAAGEADRMEARGLPLIRRGTGTSLPQPCQCLNANLCTHYEDRPLQCMQFKCGLLKSVEAGERTTDETRTLIRETSRQITKLRELLARAPSTPDTHPLSRRLAEATSSLDSLPDPGSQETRRGLAQERSVLESHLKQFLD